MEATHRRNYGNGLSSFAKFAGEILHFRNATDNFHENVAGLNGFRKNSSVS